VKLLSYVIKHDIGLAPNPYWGYCTLAVCTPNHMNAKLEKDNWILGISGKREGNQVVYLMQLTEEKMFFDNYFNDIRFTRKKPKVRGNYKELVGDNLYYMDKTNVWKQVPTLLHKTNDEKKKDLKNPYVFISKLFFYFGEKRFSLNERFHHFIVGRGIKYCIDESEINIFTDFIKSKFSPGLIGLPLNRIGRNTNCTGC